MRVSSIKRRHVSIQQFVKQTKNSPELTLEFSALLLLRFMITIFGVFRFYYHIKAYYYASGDLRFGVILIIRRVPIYRLEQLYRIWSYMNYYCKSSEDRAQKVHATGWHWTNINTIKCSDGIRKHSVDALFWFTWKILHDLMWGMAQLTFREYVLLFSEILCFLLSYLEISCFYKSWCIF